MAYKILDHEGNPVKRNGKEVLGSDSLTVVKGVDLEARTMWIIGSTENRDRDEDIIRQRGWILGPYLKNPVFLWGHDYSSVPIGAAKKVIRRRTPEARMDFLIRFPSQEGLYEFSDMIMHLYADHIINASSVGFMPYKWNELESDTSPEEDNRPEWYGRGREFTKQELLELSGCSVPSNREALQNSIKGYEGFDTRQKDLILQLMVHNERPDNADAIQEEVEKLSKDVEFEDEADTSVKIHIQGSSSDVPCKLEVIGEEEEEDAMEVRELPEGEDVRLDEATKPYPNEHACRIRAPGGYDKFRRVKCAQEVNGKCIDVIYGIKDDKAQIQSLRFKKDIWTVGAAKTVCKNRGGSFEPASSESSSQQIPDGPSKAVLKEFYEKLQAVGGLEAVKEFREGRLEVEKHICGDPNLPLWDEEKDGKLENTSPMLPVEAFVWREEAATKTSPIPQLRFAVHGLAGLVAVPKFVRECMAQLNGAKGGIPISDEGRAAAHKFLSHYYEKMGETPSALLTFGEFAFETHQQEKVTRESINVLTIEDAREVLFLMMEEEASQKRWKALFDGEGVSVRRKPDKDTQEEENKTTTNRLGLSEEDALRLGQAVRGLREELGKLNIR